ncbi:hypothetical protein AB0K21_21560 [Streptosporangium sp. NPDC049248]|uniref:hypothetical protein n=1 Tax=Streptosporangium sp. NPDC049248 TaxID=3155651 RepID=UPI003446E246
MTTPTPTPTPTATPTPAQADAAELRGAALFWHVMDTFIRPQAELGYSADERCLAKAGEIRWDQDQWRLLIGENRCGTAMCLAGYISHVAGGRWLITPAGDGTLLLNGELTILGYGYAQQMLHAEDGDDVDAIDTDAFQGVRAVSAADRALRLLGLDREYNLFSSRNTYERLVEIGEKVFGPRPTTS